jgi:hypothetical protein
MSNGMKLDERFALVEPILVGDIGTLWRADERGKRRSVAVALLDDEAEREQFLLSGVMLSGKRNVTQRAIEVGTDDDGKAFYAIEVPEGAALAERLARTPPLLFDGLVRVAVEALQELEEAHAAGVAHGHIDPWTVWSADRNNQIYGRLVGFGLYRHDAGKRGPRGLAYTAP